MSDKDKQSHIRVFNEMDAPSLDKAINEEIDAGGYKVTGVSITTTRGGQLIALVSFDIPDSN